MTNAADDTAARLGGLLETVQSQQALAQSQLQQLQSHIQGLDSVVRDEIRRTVVEELAGVVDESARAATALRALQRKIGLRSALYGALSCLLPAAVVMLGLSLWLPSQPQIAARLEQARAAELRLQQLHQAGGGADLRRCGEALRWCVRVDKHAAFGAAGDYFVLSGY